MYIKQSIRLLNAQTHSQTNVEQFKINYRMWDLAVRRLFPYVVPRTVGGLRSSEMLAHLDKVFDVPLCIPDILPVITKKVC